MTLTRSKAVQLLHRPQCITAEAALDIAQRIRGYDPRALHRPAGIFAALRKLGLAAKPAAPKPAAMEDDEGGLVIEIDDRPKAYTPLWMGAPDSELEFGMSVKDGVAAMAITGPLAEHGQQVCGEWFHGYDTIAAAIAQADANSKVQAIFLKFDTPGGVVASGLYELAASIRGRRANADAKPVWAVCELAASAGYWLASQCDRVVAPKGGMVGSIGAVMVHESFAGRLEQMGVAVEAIQFGAHKTDGAPWKSLDDAARANLQAMIDDIGEAFLADVEAGRSGRFTAEQARATEGRVYGADATEADRSPLKLGMIDAVMSEPEAFEALKAAAAERSNPLKIRTAASASVRNPAASAAQQPKEKPMKLQASNAAALARAMAADESLKDKVQKVLDEHEEADAEGEDDEADAEGEDDGAAAEGGEDDPAAEGEDDEADAEGEEDDKQAKTRLPSARAVLAILDLPEAEGREQQARTLARTPGMTVATAKAILAAGPKASRLAGKMRDVPISASGGKAPTQEEAEISAAFAHAGVRMRKR